MRKKSKTLLSLLLACVLLAGCALPGGAGREIEDASERLAESAGGRGSMPRFEDIVYTRPDIEQLRQAVEAVQNALDSGESFKRVTRLIDACYDSYYNFDTMYSLAEIRSYRDVTDGYYAAELDWCEENYNVLQQLIEDMYYACGGSVQAQQLEKRYFWDGFAEAYAQRGETALNDEIVELMRRESALLARYRAITASPTIEVDGRELDYEEYLESLYGQDAYEDALVEYYRQYNGELSELYIELVKVRRELAGSLGYDSYEQMQYDYYFERDYSPGEAEAYLADIKEHMVPFYMEVTKEDLSSSIRYDSLSDRRLHRILSGAAGKMGGQVEEAFAFMSDCELYDIEVSPVKAALSFETYLADYDAPFLFLDPYGDMEDVLSFSHEFGHYVDAYVNYNAYETVDVSECFSQAMEYLMLFYYDGELDEEEIDNLYRMKLLDTLDLYVQQASFAEFESRVYAADPEELSAAFLNELSLRLARDYGYYDGEREEYYAMSWTDITHFFEYPFYVVSYPVSNDAAMQIYELERRQDGAGLEKYLELLPREHEGLIETLRSCGLKSPFEPGRVEQVVLDLRQLLQR